MLYMPLTLFRYCYLMRAKFICTCWELLVLWLRLLALWLTLLLWLSKLSMPRSTSSLLECRELFYRLEVSKDKHIRLRMGVPRWEEDLFSSSSCVNWLFMTL